jgi:hypothetical protein
MLADFNPATPPGVLLPLRKREMVSSDRPGNNPCSIGCTTSQLICDAAYTTGWAEHTSVLFIPGSVIDELAERYDVSDFTQASSVLQTVSELVSSWFVCRSVYAEVCTPKCARYAEHDLKAYIRPWVHSVMASTPARHRVHSSAHSPVQPGPLQPSSHPHPDTFPSSPAPTPVGMYRLPPHTGRLQFSDCFPPKPGGHSQDPAEPTP